MFLNNIRKYKRGVMMVSEIYKISKKYGDKTVLNFFSLEINEEDFVCLLGVDGSGKTTILNMIMDFIRPDTGNIKVFGHDSKRNGTKIKKYISYVPTEPEFKPELKAKNLINTALSSKELSYTENTERILRIFAIDSNRRISTMPMSVRKRLSLALAFITEPKFLILDEPFVGLDEEMQKRLLIYLNSIRGKTTVLMAEKDIERAEGLGNKIVYIHKGTLLKVTDKNTLISSMVRKVRIKVAGDFTPILKFFNVDDFIEDENYVSFLFKNDINTLIEVLTNFDVLDLQISLPTLNEALVSIYDSERDKEGEVVKL